MEQTIKKQPLGITVLSLFHLISGFIVLTTSSLIWLYLDRISVLFALIFTPAERFISAGLIAGIVLILSGVLLWKGDKWGYFIASFHYLVGAVQNITTILFLPLFMTSLFPNGNPQMLILPKAFYWFYGIQVAPQLLLFAYLCLPSIREYFRVKNHSLGKIILIQLGACVAVALFALLAGVWF
ncbi:hypothetical protein KAR34_07210 [bacterium]|nr:hypothetical protein [bacterium]